MADTAAAAIDEVCGGAHDFMVPVYDTVLIIGYYEIHDIGYLEFAQFPSAVDLIIWFGAVDYAAIEDDIWNLKKNNC